MGKYKPLTTPAKCVDCLQKCVKHSYHIRCGPCVEKSGKCAKCGVQNEEFVNLEPPDEGKLAREEADFQRDLKSLPERRRRAFLRYLREAHEIGADSEEIQKLKSMLNKYSKDKDDLGFDDFEDDFADLDIDEGDDDDDDDDLSCSDQEK